MLDKKADFDAIIIGARTGGILPAQIDNAQRPETGIEDARRIAELEREVRELRRTNEVLEATNAYFLREIDPEPPVSADGARSINDAINAGVAAASWRTPPGPIRWAQTRQETRRTPQVMVEFRALGPLEAIVGGWPADLGAPKQRALLALLVSRVGQPVTMDVMQEELWEGYPPPSAITSLHAYVANLRRVLEPDRAPRTPATVLRTRGQGYLLDSRVVEVDTHRFGEHATEGWQAWRRDDPQQALSEFEAGLALWRGQPYPEVADAMYVVPEIARLEELRLSVIEGRCAALLAVGAHEVAVAELKAFMRAHPLREYGCELLSLALYRRASSAADQPEATGGEARHRPQASTATTRVPDPEPGPSSGLGPPCVYHCPGGPLVTPVMDLTGGAWPDPVSASFTVDWFNTSVARYLGAHRITSMSSAR